MIKLLFRPQQAGQSSLEFLPKPGKSPNKQDGETGEVLPKSGESSNKQEKQEKTELSTKADNSGKFGGTFFI